MCARRQVTTEPVPLRTVRSSRRPSSSSISRTRTRSATRMADGPDAAGGSGSGGIVGVGRERLAFDPGPCDTVDGHTDTEDTIVAGPAIDVASVIADLHPFPGRVHGRHQVQVDRPGDTSEDDVPDLQLRRVDRSNDHLLPTAYQRDHGGATGPERHGGAVSNPACHCVQCTHPVIVADSPASPHRFTSPCPQARRTLPSAALLTVLRREGADAAPPPRGPGVGPLRLSARFRHPQRPQERRITPAELSALLFHARRAD